MTPEKLPKLLRLSYHLSDREFASEPGVRASRAESLGFEFYHLHALPALLAGLMNRNEDLSVRAACALAVSRIEDPCVVAPLIDIMDDPQIGLRAHRVLRRLIGAAPREIPKEQTEISVADALRLQGAWQTWWKANRKTAKLQHKSMIEVVIGRAKL